MFRVVPGISHGDNQPVKIQPYASADRHVSDDEIAAAIAGVQAYLDMEQPRVPEEQATDSGWQRAAKLSVQSLRPVKLATPPRWNTIERLRRGSGGFYGIVGL